MNQHVIIDSIGTATPAVSTLLSDAFGIPQEIFLKLLYNTPSVMFNNVDEGLAHQAEELLEKLGLEVRVTRADEELPASPELVDIAVYVQDVRQLPLVAQQLAAFLGCDAPSALKLLMKEPAIVLGNVSAATAEALSKRLNAEVYYSYPRHDLYTLTFTTSDAQFANQVRTFLGMPVGDSGPLKDLGYGTCQELWRRFPAEGKYTLENQSFVRNEVILDSVNEALRHAWKPILTDEIGMPDEILPDVLANLPVQLHESVSRGELQNLLGRYQTSGMSCHFRPLPHGAFFLSVQRIMSLDQVRQVLGQFLPGPQLPSNEGPWMSTTSLPHVLCRYAVAQLEDIGCEAEIMEMENGN